MREYYVQSQIDVVDFSPKNPRRQRFSVPEDVILYLLKNNTPSLFQKLIRCCKYFFKKQSFSLVDSLIDGRGVLTVLETNSPKLAIVGEEIFLFDRHDFSDITPKLFFVNVEEINLRWSPVNYKTLLFLTSWGRVKNFHIEKSPIEHSDGTLVKLVDILKQFPLLERFTL